MAGSLHKIISLKLENFTCFERADFQFSPGINVLIGENGSGKTHVMKVAYLALMGQRDYGAESNSFRLWWEDLQGLFQVKKEQLFRKEPFLITFSSLLGREELRGDGTKGGSYSPEIKHNLPQTLFLPPYEMLSWQKGFINLYLKQETGFDLTWFELAVALNGNLLKNEAYYEARKLVTILEEAIGATVEKRDDRFFLLFKNGQKPVESPVVAQGVNKLAQLIFLVMNGSLTRETILFWDEPETNLNPKYIAVIAKFLLALAKSGVQVFVATHDYLLTHLLSLDAEYRPQNGQSAEIKFFSFYKAEDGSTAIESGSTLAALSHNVILDEYASLHDHELGLYQQQIAAK